MEQDDKTQWEKWMRLALEEASLAVEHGDVPVGAVVITPEGEVIATGHNTRHRDHDPTGHAEIVALRQAATILGHHRLDGTTLVVTLEPCVMCAGAIAQSGVTRLIYGAWDEKAGACGGGPYDVVRDRSLPHRVDQVIGGVLGPECSRVLAQFFDQLREQNGSG
jgi:tRNA(adenine34) deaminase